MMKYSVLFSLPANTLDIVDSRYTLASCMDPAHPALTSINFKLFVQIAWSVTAVIDFLVV